MLCGIFLVSRQTIGADWICFAVNYIDSTYTADEAHTRYYPTHTERLKALKDKYDPNRVINFPQDF